jgi:hypothetical protein
MIWPLANLHDKVHAVPACTCRSKGRWSGIISFVKSEFVSSTNGCQAAGEGGDDLCQCQCAVTSDDRVGQTESSTATTHYSSTDIIVTFHWYRDRDTVSVSGSAESRIPNNYLSRKGSLALTAVVSVPYLDASCVRSSGCVNRSPRPPFVVLQKLYPHPCLYGFLAGPQESYLRVKVKPMAGIPG